MSVLSKPGVRARRILLCALPVALIIPMMAWSDESSQIGIDNFKFSQTRLRSVKGPR